jgi:DNA-binding response OmpR family regulator
MSTKMTYQIDIGSFKFNKKKFQCSFFNNKIDLLNSEYDLLNLFLRNKEKFLSKELLFRLISENQTNSRVNININVHDHVNKLIDKLEIAGVERRVITRQGGRGYTLHYSPFLEILNIDEKEFISSMLIDDVV